MQSITMLVAWREFRERIRSRGFLLSSLGMPIFLIVIWLFTGSMNVASPVPDVPEIPFSQMPVVRYGYVDRFGILQGVDTGPSLIAYDDDDGAADALRRGEIDAYYLIPVDYAESGTVRRVSLGLPSTQPDAGTLVILLREGLVADYAPEVAKRLLAPLGDQGLQVVTLNERAVNDQDPGMLPFVVTAAIMVPLFTGGGLLLRSLAQEKESRVMEILLVSLRPNQLLAGKVIGMAALVIVQYLAWVLILGLLLPLTGATLGEALRGLNLTTGESVVMLLYGLNGFFLYAAIMAGLGAVAPDVHSSQNWVFIITLPMMIPFYLWMALISAPHGVLAVALSLFPFSAPMAMILRMTSTVVPVWQLALGLVLMMITTLYVTRTMARLFRTQVLLSGEPLSLSRFAQVLRTS
jgi:ABC-2 type transport system permease protein